MQNNFSQANSSNSQLFVFKIDNLMRKRLKILTHIISYVQGDLMKEIAQDHFLT